MQNKRKILSSMVILACAVSVTTQVQATLPSNAILKFDAGVTTTNSSSVSFVKSGSYFGMDTNGNTTVAPSERVALVTNTGLTLGKTQSASGTHSGTPDGSESEGLDKAWSFFGNTGLDLTTVAPTVISDNGAGTVTLDFSGWTVSWNAIPTIPLGSRPWEGNPEGVANITCAVDCAAGDTFTLNYSATVPDGDPSGFGNVLYNLKLVGIVTVPEGLAVSSGASGPGSVALAVSSTDGRISMDDLVNNGGVADSGFSFGAGLVDFVVTGIGTATVAVIIPQTAPIPANAVYRKFINGSWATFTSDGTNLVASAPIAASVCPPINDTAYNHTNGLVEGDECVQLVIEDDGPYDADTSATNIADPGGVAAPIIVIVDTRTSSTDGCSMTGNSSSAKEHADWWLVAAFIGVLGWFNFKRERGSNKA